jgi:hypothetical protein
VKQVFGLSPPTSEAEEDMVYVYALTLTVTDRANTLWQRCRGGFASEAFERSTCRVKSRLRRLSGLQAGQGYCNEL